MTPLHPLKRPYDRRMRTFGKQLSRAVQGEVEPLHQCRVASRRLREILPLCRMNIPDKATKRARAKLHQVGRALGGVREIDVTFELVADLGQKQLLVGPAAARVRRHLRDERDARRERMLDRLSTIRVKKLERDLAELGRTLGIQPQVDAWALAVAQRVARRARRVRDAVATAGALYVPERVHAVRIAAKKLRYALEFADDTGEAQTKPLTRQLKVLQETLGHLHDLEVLHRVVRDLTCADAHVDSCNGDLEALRPELDRECRELHSRYVGTRALLLELCDTAMTVAVQIWTDHGGAGTAGRALKMSLPEAGGTRLPERRRRVI